MPQSNLAFGLLLLCRVAASDLPATENGTWPSPPPTQSPKDDEDEIDGVMLAVFIMVVILIVLFVCWLCCCYGRKRNERRLLYYLFCDCECLRACCGMGYDGAERRAREEDKVELKEPSDKLRFVIEPP